MINSRGKTAISQKTILEVLRTFLLNNGNRYNLKKLGIFGSCARNQNTANSDVDVVFVTDHPDLFMTAMMKQELEDVLGAHVDVVRLRKNMNPRFKERIERDVIYV